MGNTERKDSSLGSYNNSSLQKEETLREWGLDFDDLVYENEQGVKQLNPIYQALIAERLQFDGDIPELRTGPLPEGGMPAVPVKTSSRSLVALGSQLETASERVQALTTGSTTAIASYKAGQPAQFQEVEVPSNLLALSREKKQTLAFKAISSTQGRNSATLVILGILKSRFPKLTFVEKIENPNHEFRWTFTISQSGSTNTNFSAIDNAAFCLGNKLQRLAKGAEKVSVRAIHTIQERSVGWSLSIL